MERTKKLLEYLAVPNAEEKQNKMEKYGKELLAWNGKVNLTGVSQIRDLDQKHFADSIVIAGLEEFQRAGWIADVGTGGGFPGVPLAILFPQKNFVLLDALQKRIKVMKEMVEALNLSNITLIHGRAEDLGRNAQYREHFDLVLSRAVAHMAVLSEYCLPLTRIDGTFFAYKGSSPHGEIEESQRAVNLLGGGQSEILVIPELYDQDLLGLNHTLIKVKKERKTPDSYPRKAGKPSKKPL